MAKRSGSPPGKSGKKPKYASKFQLSWKETFPWISPSQKGLTFAYCTVCSSDLKISSGGKNDVLRHGKNNSHMLNERVRTGSSKVTSFFVKKDFTQEDAVIKAETIFANFMVQHDMPFAAADHYPKLMKEMFPDSKIAKKYDAGKAKVTQIVKGALGPNNTDQLIQLCRSSPFSLMCYESNDLSSEKRFVILIRGYDEAILKVTTRFLDMPVCNAGTAEMLFCHIEDAIASRSIPWTNLLAYNSDNCGVMTGARNSVLSQLKEKQPKLVNMGCICHLTNLVTAAGVEKVPYPIDDLLIDVLYHFHHSSEWKEEYRQFNEFYEVDPLKLHEHCQTRWLNLLKCVTRTLQQWPALESYFTSHADAEHAGRVKRIQEFLSNPEVRLYFYFAKFLLKPLADFNATFQTEETKILSLYPEMLRLVKEVLSFFIPAPSLRAASDDMGKVVFKGATHQLSDEDLNIGTEARAYLLEKEEGDLDTETVSKFFTTVRSTYEAVIEKALKCFPLHDERLKTLWILQPAYRNEASQKMVLYLAEQFPQLVTPDVYDDLREEFAEYQTMDEKEVPKEESVDTFWGKLGRMKLLGGQPRFPLLSKLAKGSLCIPHSNTSSERTFSVLKKIKTDFGYELGHDTLCAILSLKFNQGPCCQQTDFTDDVLKSAKKATYLYNKDHKN